MGTPKQLLKDLKKSLKELYYVVLTLWFCVEMVIILNHTKTRTTPLC